MSEAIVADKSKPTLDSLGVSETVAQDLGNSKNQVQPPKSSQSRKQFAYAGLIILIALSVLAVLLKNLDD